jgi:hypothetical protein
MMAEVVFRYQTVLPIGRDTPFAMAYPAEADWLRQHADGARISVYRWPEFVAHFVCDQIGMTVYEFEVWLEQEIAEQFGHLFNKRWASND